MIFSLPIVGWILGWVFCFSLAVPFWWFWNDLAPVYFYWLPPVYQSIPFGHCIGLFVVIAILKFVLTPRFSNPDLTKSFDKKK